MLLFIIPILIICIAVYLMRVSDKKVSDVRITGSLYQKIGTKFERWCYKHDGSWSFIAVVSTGILVILLGALVCNHIEYASFPSEYQSVKITLSTASTHVDIERAAIVQKVMDVNRELAVVKYWDDSIWVGWFWPDRVAELEFIK